MYYTTHEEFVLNSLYFIKCIGFPDCQFFVSLDSLNKIQFPESETNTDN